MASEGFISKLTENPSLDRWQRTRIESNFQGQQTCESRYPNKLPLTLSEKPSSRDNKIV